MGNLACCKLLLRTHGSRVSSLQENYVFPVLFLVFDPSIQLEINTDLSAKMKSVFI